MEAENKKDDNFRNLQADSEITSGAENTSEKPDGNPVNLHGGFERPGSLENNFQIKTETADFKNEIMKQVLETAKVLTDGEKSEMTMELKPDGLGKLTLKVITEQGMVFAKISAENSQVKGIIESNMDLLRDTLEKQGMILNGIDVSVGQDSGNDTGSEGFLPYGNKRNPEASEILSELDISGGGKHHLLKNPYEPDMGSIDFRA